ncbi:MULTISPECIES: C13 family peptidase [Pseudomonadaceae]|uniref:C13 family peptidase n=1 Tax=Pseudomonadaceae TaxID=135621 RepID=UPI0015E2B292|nr:MULTISPECIES: C13 family peptidase [Pseudomonadaceae]MBA1276659.1 peptidase C13 [Stutzerimonas stutzeri]MBC8649163.1 peptidase C13 [Pseudomonas sp. MT4]QXY93116.1 peptidase C13 [Pseudomonas sp. MTM4]
MRHLAPLLFVSLLAACGDGEPLLPADAVLPDGGRYRGEIVDGLLQGQGRIDYPNGSYYTGTFKDGQWHGHGRWQGANGDRYDGEFKQGLFDGQGRFSYATGGVYEGRFERGSLNGAGRYSEPGLSYEGEFKNDLYEGTGKLASADGVTYEGEFAAGQLHGEGTRSDASGVFIGTFVNGSLNGEGVYRGSSGEHYLGGFENDLFHGQGRYEDANGDVWKGTFKQGELSGKGEYASIDGTRYSGEFRQWQYHGKGRLEQPDGSLYQGDFRAGRFEGTGTLTRADGTKQSGTWRAGRLIEDSSGKHLSDPLELGLLNQGRLLSEALDAVPPSTPAAELYSLTFAGDGQQSVFLREVDYVDRLLTERFAARGQISLANHRDHIADRPLATRENLSRAIQTLAERSGPEDLIFIYLTSHGSADHELAVAQPRLALEDLPAAELARLLAPLADRNKLVVISACYSGGFIEPLKSQNTLVITAARADRVSFGCSEESDFTYFGRALFAEALHETSDILQAFTLAQAKVAEREQADHYQASEPQIWAPEQVVEHWRALTEQPSTSTD